MYNKHVNCINGALVSDESEMYTMTNGWGDTVTIIEDYGSDVSYLLMDGNDAMRFDDATRASNYAFRLGYRE